MLDLFVLTAITCGDLTPPSNGMVGFSSSALAPYEFGVTATYTCDTGFGLYRGDGMRTCGGDGSSPNGMWSGASPNCEGAL